MKCVRWLRPRGAQSSSDSTVLSSNGGPRQKRWSSYKPSFAERIRFYEAISVDFILCAFLHSTDELPAFGREVIPLLRKEKVRAGVTQDCAARAKVLA
jgi:hypothetical protein